MLATNLQNKGMIYQLLISIPSLVKQADDLISLTSRLVVEVSSKWGGRGCGGKGGWGGMYFTHI